MSALLIDQFKLVRLASVDACEPLLIEDYGLQAAEYASPPKWHLAHTSWFFETFLLKPFQNNYVTFNPEYEVLFNSYYNSIGDQFPRPKRGLLSRPSVADILAYRQHIDEAMEGLITQNHPDKSIISQRCLLGIQHEKQHQELFFTDLKYSFSVNPLYPQYQPEKSDTATTQPSSAESREIVWQTYTGGLIEIGADSQTESFTFDNESPAHKVWLEPFTLADRLVTNEEFQLFIDNGGYNNPRYWLADGWAEVQNQQWQHPLYWREIQGRPFEFTLNGLRERVPNQPVCHISGYEADAYACWADARLPTEAEWEFAARQQRCSSADKTVNLHPDAAAGNERLLQLYDSCWQWTGSAYRPYPGFKPSRDAIGEYNGKFMCNQWVLRGGSCVSSGDHTRASYRNFFYPGDRWQFSGIRLAK